jgi:Fe-S-cluster containining protein
MDLFDHDRAFLARLDAAMDEARRRAGPRFGCGPGRDDCCRGPFPINRLDARRLQRGLAELEAVDPARAAELRRRARAAVATLREDFPGDAAAGLLSDNGDADAFFERHGSLPCPALDPARRTCELYAHRPWTCRTYGPPIRIGDEDLPACPHCFAPCTAEETAALRVEPDPEGLEDALLDQLQREERADGRETLVAHALAGKP